MIREYKSDPEFLQRFEEFISESRIITSSISTSSTVYNIPVVAHVFSDATSIAFGVSDVEKIILETNAALDIALSGKNIDINLFLAKDCNPNGVYLGA